MHSLILAPLSGPQLVYIHYYHHRGRADFSTVSTATWRPIVMAEPRPLRRSSNENVIDQLICKATRAHAFRDPGDHFFSKTSIADIFEVDASGGVVRSGVRHKELRSAIQVLKKNMKWFAYAEVSIVRCVIEQKERTDKSYVSGSLDFVSRISV